MGAHQARSPGWRRGEETLGWDEEVPIKRVGKYIKTTRGKERKERTTIIRNWKGPNLLARVVVAHLRGGVQCCVSASGRRRSQWEGGGPIKPQVEFRFSIRHAILRYLVPSVARRRRSLRSCSSSPRLWPTVSTCSDKSTGSLHEHNNWQETGKEKTKKKKLISLGEETKAAQRATLDQTRDNNCTWGREAEKRNWEETQRKKENEKEDALIIHQLTQFKFIIGLPIIVTQLDLINWLETTHLLVSFVYSTVCCQCCPFFVVLVWRKNGGNELLFTLVSSG